MYKFYILFLLVSFQGYAIQTNTLPKNLEIKLNKVLVEQFSSNFESKEILTFSTDILKIANFNNESDLIYRLKNKNGKNLGFAYLGQAKSKKANYDYVVIFDENLIISNIKVLIYREDHGGEIGSKRWLKQFLGFTTNQNIVYKKDIAGISGATISATSLTNAINNVLKTVGNLHQLKQL